MTLTLFDIFYIVKSYIGLGLRLVKYSFLSSSTFYIGR